MSEKQVKDESNMNSVPISFATGETVIVRARGALYEAKVRPLFLAVFVQGVE